MTTAFNEKLSTILALALLSIMGALMALSVRGDSLTMDELAHIPAGYSYLSERDYRLNPEHPPLIKDLSAIIPYFFLHPKFPTDAKAWTTDLNGQWDMGRLFLYGSGNDADSIIWWSRVPMMALTLLFGWLFFRWVRRRYGAEVAILSLFFFALSPTFIAHGRYVTTDVAAAFAFFLGITTFLWFLERATYARAAWAGAALGVALLLKFSTVLLLPLDALFALVWLFVVHFEDLRRRNWGAATIHYVRQLWLLLLPSLVLAAVAVIVVWGVYAFHIQNYPAARQLSDSAEYLKTFGFRPAVTATLWMAERPLTRPLAQYALGILMVIQRAAGGNTTYFLGDITNTGWWYYFPVAYALKESLPFLMLALGAVVVAVRFVRRVPKKSLANAMWWARDNFVLVAGVLFIAVYWYQSMRSPLNIGVRHVLPTFPFIYLFVARELVRGLTRERSADPRTLIEWFLAAARHYLTAIPKFIVLFAMLAWMALETVFAFPNYLSYYNEFGGGVAGGHRYIVDSNYDWGQDLRRLASFVDDNNIKKIGIDYFGGGSPEYYMGAKAVSWWSSRGAPNIARGDPEWLAVSASTLESAQARPVKNWQVTPENSYVWLRGIKPVARAGQSIFIFHLAK